MRGKDPGEAAGAPVPAFNGNSLDRIIRIGQHLPGFIHAGFGHKRMNRKSEQLIKPLLKFGAVEPEFLTQGPHKNILCEIALNELPDFMKGADVFPFCDHNYTGLMVKAWP
jgi:hypothetical protein